MMKKLILTPKSDSITLCLPPDWVGKSIVCILKEPQETEMVTEVSEDAIQYQADRFRKNHKESRERKKRLRRYL